MIETPGVALVVIPHPDDAEGWCGGTVARWIKDGAEVHYVLCTDGGKGSDDPQMDPQQLAVIRENEQLEAASVLGVKDVVLLRHPDGELEDTGEFRKEIVRAIRRLRPIRSTTSAEDASSRPGWSWSTTRASSVFCRAIAGRSRSS